MLGIVWRTAAFCPAMTDLGTEPLRAGVTAVATRVPVRAKSLNVIGGPDPPAAVFGWSSYGPTRPVGFRDVVKVVAGVVDPLMWAE